jgi:hypothetical protein
MADTIGEIDIRGENIERAVKGFANKLYKLRPILKMENSSNWQESYYRETSTPLTAGGNRSVNQVARGALPPELHPSWTKVTTYNRKFMGQGTIFYEDIKTNAIATQARTMFRVAEAIVNAVDLYIYTALTAEGSTSGVVAAQDDWDSVTIANRDPIGDILIGIGAMTTNNYDVKSNGYLLVKPRDYASLLRNSKVINNPSFKTADVVSNGKVGQICGLTIIESTNVSADEAMIVMGNRAATWKGVVGLMSQVITDPGVNVKVRAWEMGHIQITDPQALYTITEIDVSA